MLNICILISSAFRESWTVVVLWEVLVSKRYVGFYLAKNICTIATPWDMSYE